MTTLRPRRRALSGLLGCALSLCCPLAAMGQAEPSPNTPSLANKPAETPDAFPYLAEMFADLRILRYKVEGFDELSLQQKKLAYYLSQAALAGRDIFWDQNYRHNLTIRRTLEEIFKTYAGNRQDPQFAKFHTYLKRVWFASGIHHHYANDKMIPDFSRDYFRQLITQSSSASFPTRTGENPKELGERLIPILFDPKVDAKRVSKGRDIDVVKTSAVNYYRNLTQAEVESIQEKLVKPGNKHPVSFGLNSRLTKLPNGKILEEPYKIGGLYGAALTHVVTWLSEAMKVAETPKQREALAKLISYYRTGDLQRFDEYNVLWVQDTEPRVDAINGFIEVYNDPLGYRGAFESIVSMKDMAATKRFGILSEQAPWFEANSPIADEHKRAKVTGISYKVITVLTQSGESSPPMPIGINLPNSTWIRTELGSKSVSLGNIEAAYAEQEKVSGAVQEFYLPEAQQWIKQYGHVSNLLMTGMHEVIGHASGKIADGVGQPTDTLNQYHNTLEEGRADLVALYFMPDQHLVDLKLSPSTDIVKSTYTEYITGGLMKQLVRIEEGKNVEEDHMRNRQMIAQWVFEQGKEQRVIERVVQDGKTYFKVNDFVALRALFGRLLREVQRIKSTGDFQAAQYLVEHYGVQVDRTLHKEVKERWAKLNIAAYSGFLNPTLTPVTDAKGAITNVKITPAGDFTSQMLEYAAKYSFLPHEN